MRLSFRGYVARSPNSNNSNNAWNVNNDGDLNNNNVDNSNNGVRPDFPEWDHRVL